MNRLCLACGLALSLGIVHEEAIAVSVEKTSFVILKQPGRYIGWPSIARTAAGELLIAFSGDREGHVCPFDQQHAPR